MRIQTSRTSSNRLSDGTRCSSLTRWVFRPVRSVRQREGGVERWTRCMALTNCFPCPYNFLTMCCMPKIDSQVRGGAVWGCCCLQTISLPSAYHVLTISSPFATCPELTASCEGGRFGVAAVCVPFPDQLLTMSLQFVFHLLHALNLQQDARGLILGLLQFAYNFLTACLLCPYNVLTICYMPRIDSKLQRGAVSASLPEI